MYLGQMPGRGHGGPYIHQPSARLYLTAASIGAVPGPLPHGEPPYLTGGDSLPPYMVIFIFIFNIFCKLILNLTLFFFQI